MCVCIWAYWHTHAIVKHMRVSARREGRGCRIAGRGLVFILISHRLSSSCQTLRPPPCGAPSFHRIRVSRVLIPSLLLPFWTFFFSDVFSYDDDDFTKLCPSIGTRESVCCSTFVTIFVMLCFFYHHLMLQRHKIGKERENILAL